MSDTGRDHGDLFDLADEYDAMLARGLRLSGETREYFIRGRIAELGRRLRDEPPGRILDFGCGTGDTTTVLARTFDAEVTGVDTARGVLEHARRTHGGDRVRFASLDEIGTASYDLCYVNGVFHHIEPPRRGEALTRIRDALRPGGGLALFENNPWNPGTRLIMSRVEFDRDAATISPPAARRMLRAAEFETSEPTRFLFYFPRALKALRPLERRLDRLPLGGQYLVLARRP